MSTHGIASSGPGEWVLLWYRMPREPSTPRIAIWRKLKRLGVAQLGDGLITLPADARTRGQLDWIARRSPKAVTDPADVATGATAFDMGGVELGLHGGDCSFKTILSCQDLTDPVLWKIAAIVHGADLADERYDAPEAPGLDVVLRGLWMVCGDAEVLALAGAAVRRAVRVRPPRAAAGPRPSMTGIGRMTSRRPRAAAAAAAVVVVMVAGFAWASWRAHAAREDLRDLPLRVVADLPLGGGSSRFDYLSLHPARDRLYLAHLGADLVTVVDVRRRVVLADIAGVPAPHGCWWCLRLAAPTPQRPPRTSWSPWTPPAIGCWPARRPGSSPTGSPTTRPPASCCLRRVGRRGDRHRRGNWAAHRRGRAWRRGRQRRLRLGQRADAGGGAEPRSGRGHRPARPAGRAPGRAGRL